MNIEDRRPSKIQPLYKGLSLSNRFNKQENYTVPKVKKKTVGRRKTKGYRTNGR